MRIGLGLLAGLIVLAGIAYLMRDALLRIATPSGGAVVKRSIAFVAGDRGTLDVYVPKGAANAPVVVFFYGGAWQMGRKELYGFVGNALAARGMVAIVPDYRVYPQVRFPQFLNDGAQAIRWAKDNAASFGGDPDRLFVMGHSAGAHIAAMLALDRQWLAAVRLDPARDLAGLIGISGPYDFLPLRSATLVAVFDGNNRPETQPIEFASSGAPPSLILTGDTDTIVQPRNSFALAARLREAGANVSSIVYPGRGHFGSILALVGPLRFLAPVADDVAGFVRQTGARSVQDIPAQKVFSR